MAMEGQGRVPIFDFPVISNDSGPKDPEVGDQWTETVWVEDPPPGDWNRGKRLGKVTILVTGTEQDPEFVATFDFKPEYEDTTVDGKVPGGREWKGKGKGKARGPKPEKEVPIEFKNPKRWG